MAPNSQTSINKPIVLIPKSSEIYLGSIRHWDNLSIAIEADEIWIKGFDDEQINNKALALIPSIEIFELRGQMLFKKDKLVPIRKMRAGLLFSPISVILNVTLHNFNHNFFKLNQSVKISLLKSTDQHPAFALKATIADTKSYVEQAMQMRLQALSWVILDNKALILGTPLLSIPGATFWKNGNHLLPTGYDFELKNLIPFIEHKINPDQQALWFLWQTNGTYIPIAKESFQSLSISSLRLSIN